MGMVKEDDGGSNEESCITDSECMDDEEHEKDEAFRKNPYICEHSVDHYYYLLPRAKRSNIFTRKKPPAVIPSQEKGLPDELKEKISRMGVQITEVRLAIQKVLYDTDLSYKHVSVDPCQPSGG
ncbi:hypothetical protein RDI58_004143 [Solanum bulbocastanum]|uniref:Uncharacterized protein n=1 Tax=Solanum bulbocastanum TaxID=147425 RepID=A0AAN8U5Z2_SOLBU